MLRIAPARMLSLMLATMLAGCAALSVDALLPADAVLLGEQHDAPSHQEQHRRTVETLAARGTLAALAIEMAEQGASTAGLPRDANEAAVRAALRWDEQGWPWAAYGPAVMAAVRSGVPVLGANLPRARMREAMAEAGLDDVLATAGLQQQRQAIRDGHCGLLPEAQVPAMARIQIARDRAMAQTVAGAAVPGKTVLLVAGGGHVDEALGVPRHLPASLRTASLRWPPQPVNPPRDYCAELRQRMPPKG